MRKGMLSTLIGFWIGYEGASWLVHIAYWTIIAAIMAGHFYLKAHAQ